MPARVIAGMGELLRGRFGSERACSSARELISLALDGELSAREAVRLRGHLLACPDCSAYRRQLLAVAAALRQSAPELAREGATWPTTSRSKLSGRMAGLAAAAALALTGLATLGGAGGGPTPTGALSATQGLPVYSGLSPEQGYPSYVYHPPLLPFLD
jgi:predicted anti-sigma-YlaC factor YlaD